MEVCGMFTFSGITNSQLDDLESKIRGKFGNITGRYDDMSRVLADVQPHSFYSTDPVKLAEQKRGIPVQRSVSIFVNTGSEYEGRGYIFRIYRMLNSMPGYGCTEPKTYVLK